MSGNAVKREMQKAEGDAFSLSGADESPDKVKTRIIQHHNLALSRNYDLKCIISYFHISLLTGLPDMQELTGFNYDLI